MRGDTTTGVSIMKIQPHHFDVGDILAQRELPIRSDIFMPELHSALSHLGADLLLDTINNLKEQLANATPQDETLASFAPKITSRITEIVWSEQTALELYARYRALYGFKCLTTSFVDKQVQLIEVQKPLDQSPSQSPLPPGQFTFHRGRRSLMIGCAGGTLLEVTQIRLEGKKTMSAQDFNNGFLKRAASLQFKRNKHVACC
ncbi:hypothetical protein ACLKA6_014344 [Drosophila palustris]